MLGLPFHICLSLKDELIDVQVALAVAVSAITQIHLRQVTFHPIGQTGFGFVTGSCLLGSDYRLNNPCYYAWVVAAVSLFASFAVSMAQVSPRQSLSIIGFRILEYCSGYHSCSIFLHVLQGALGVSLLHLNEYRDDV